MSHGGPRGWGECVRFRGNVGATVAVNMMFAAGFRGCSSAMFGLRSFWLLLSARARRTASSCCVGWLPKAICLLAFVTMSMLAGVQTTLAHTITVGYVVT